jgi:hypothetical protein
VGVDGDQERSAEPIQAVDEERGELALFGVLEEGQDTSLASNYLTERFDAQIHRRFIGAH